MQILCSRPEFLKFRVCMLIGFASLRPRATSRQRFREGARVGTFSHCLSGRRRPLSLSLSLSLFWRANRRRSNPGQTNFLMRIMNERFLESAGDNCLSSTFSSVCVCVRARARIRAQTTNVRRCHLLRFLLTFSGGVRVEKEFVSSFSAGNLNRQALSLKR